MQEGEDNLFDGDDGSNEPFETLTPEERKSTVDHLENKVDANAPSLHNIKNDVTGDLTCEFLEVAMQQILFHRGIYPKEIFQRRKKYHVPVQMCMYPDLAEYIAEVLNGLKSQIAQNEIEQIVLSILQSGTVLESFVFELASVKLSSDMQDDQQFLNLELAMRDCLLKIASYDYPRPKEPAKCSFKILAHVRRSSAMQLLFDDGSRVTWVKENETSSNKEQKLYPLKTINNSSFMKLQLYVLST